jgi:hypothetical protein
MKLAFRNTVAGVLAIATLVTVSLAGSNAFAEKKDLAGTLQERVAKLSPEQQAALLALLDQLAPVKAATASAAAATPEEAMRQGLREFEAGKAEKKFDLDLAMSHISEDFEHYSGTRKDGARNFLEGIISAAGTEGIAAITISLDKTTYKVTGDKAEIYPVEVSTPIGSATLTIHGKLEGGVWRVIGVDGI